MGSRKIAAEIREKWQYRKKEVCVRFQKNLPEGERTPSEEAQEPRCELRISNYFLVGNGDDSFQDFPVKHRALSRDIWTFNVKTLVSIKYGLIIALKTWWPNGLNIHWH
ncbi:hypothetical protein CEXT_214961 [Caerostris extrusa]|uniref:Uncharacterized protein n=1 Tax=Caerostris extrusa TaxID=172846 RepID=A0AAV4M4Q0_CAEEX|nr:hypothetical protein CEXT_214961 [Caerostris extrusa]